MESAEKQALLTRVDISIATRAAANLYSAPSTFPLLMYVLLVVLAVRAPIGEVAAYATAAVSVAMFVCLITRKRLDHVAYAAFLIFMSVLAGIDGALVWRLSALLGSLPAAGWDSLITLLAAIACLLAFGGFLAWLIWPSIRLLLAPSNILGSTPIELNRKVNAFLASSKQALPLLHKPENPIRATLYFLLFLLILAVAGITLTIPEAPGFYYLIIASSAAWYMWRRHYAWSAERLMTHDKRSPVVFLRSFVDDGVRLRASGFVPRWRARTIEEAMAPLARGVGPFVTFANPTSRLPPLGAAKAFHTNDTWQGAIEEWIVGARLIVLAAGRTDSVKWEIEKIVAVGAMHKLVIVLPPDRKGHKGERFQWLRTYFVATPYEAAIGELDVDRTIALVFMPDRVLAIGKSSTKKREIDFIVAFNTAIYAAVMS
ncbi:MAG TPA: hypothetical protein VFV07_12865 [Rhizomicrobium sp.]|nr:hypothetical protein [Rhizomicrobium sp.]